METTNGSKNGVPASGHRYSFGDFVIDPANRTCLRDGVGLPITGKVFDILLAFLESPGRLLTKDELMERVWADEFVEEGNLARNVSTLRKALGDTEKQHRYILTVPGHGYRFSADVATLGNEQPVKPDGVQHLAEVGAKPAAKIERSEHQSHKLFWVLAGVILLFTAAWFGKDRLFATSPTVRFLAVLPLRGIDPNDNYMGVGIADAVIRRLSSSGEITVRPTSAVLHYLNQETDTLAAARELNADAILEGNVQRSGERLRVSVNLLRTVDGSSIWNDSFDLQEADIFRVQDEVAEQVANRLQIRLAPRKSSVPQYPAAPEAYEVYIKGIASLDQRGYGDDAMDQMNATIDLFNRAIKLDPNYALAHAQLAFAYAWTALFIEPGENKWADLSRVEIQRAQDLDPNLAESHLAKAMLLWSVYDGFKIEDALRELMIAKSLNPNSTHGELVGLLGHAGLYEQAERELNRLLEVDPTSSSLADLRMILPYLMDDPDRWYVERSRFPIKKYVGPWYYMRKGMFSEAQASYDEILARGPLAQDQTLQRLLLVALKGNVNEAVEQVPGELAKLGTADESRHHSTYDAACIYALAGNSLESVRWLRETATTGFPNYPLFARDPYLDRIRQSPDFIQFLAEQKAQWEHLEQEFPVE